MRSLDRLLGLDEYSAVQRSSRPLYEWWIIGWGILNWMLLLFWILFFMILLVVFKNGWIFFLLPFLFASWLALNILPVIGWGIEILITKWSSQNLGQTIRLVPRAKKWGVLLLFGITGLFMILILAGHVLG